MITSSHRTNLLKHEFSQTESPIPASYYIGLATNDTTGAPDSFDGTAIVEPDSATGYARMQLTNDTDNWVVNDKYAANKNNITFAAFTATAAPATNVKYWFIADANTGSTCLYYGLLSEVYPVIKTAQVIIPAEQMKIYLLNEGEEI